MIPEDDNSDIKKELDTIQKGIDGVGDEFETRFEKLDSDVMGIQNYLGVMREEREDLQRSVDVIEGKIDELFSFLKKA